MADAANDLARAVIGLMLRQDHRNRFQRACRARTRRLHGGLESLRGAPVRDTDTRAASRLPNNQPGSGQLRECKADHRTIHGKLGSQVPLRRQPRSWNITSLPDPSRQRFDNAPRCQCFSLRHALS